MKSTIEAIEKAGLREKVKTMIGGGQIDKLVCDYVGADAYGFEAMAAVRLAKQWIQLPWRLMLGGPGFEQKLRWRIADTPGIKK